MSADGIRGASSEAERNWLTQQVVVAGPVRDGIGAHAERTFPHEACGLLVGRIESDQWLRRWEATNKEKTYDEFLVDMAKAQKLPMGRVGTAEEFANMACFLCSDAGSYITGCAINVDGGLSPVV